MTNTVTLPVSDLVEDFELYPRCQVNEHHVHELVEALRSGEQLPPVIADEQTKVIVDGWHRVRAYRRVYGDGAEIPVTLKRYESRAEMVKDAVRLNCQHGLRLYAVDLVRSVRMMRDHGYDEQQISATIGKPVERVRKLEIRYAVSENHQVVPLKRPVVHLAGTVLNRQQVQVHQKLVGTPFQFHAKQLSEALEADMLPRDDERLIQELKRLHKALSTFLASLPQQDELAASRN